MTVYYARALWLWLTERVAVEIVRLKTGWLADAWLYLTDVVRGRGRGTGLHVLPAGEPVDDDSWRGHVGEIVTTCCAHPGTGICMCDCHDWDDQLEPLPYNDLSQYIDAAWAATGMTQAEYWASVARLSDSPWPQDRSMADYYRAQAPEPTPAQRQLLWRANDVIPPRIAATLARAQADQTVIDSDLTPETRAALVEQFAGGDVYDGQGEAWFNVFDAIEARAHERLQQARAELDRWFTPAGAR